MLETSEVYVKLCGIYIGDIYPLFASVGFHVKIPIFTVTFVEIIYHYCISIEHFLPPNLQSGDECPLELPFSAEPL